MTLIPTPTPLPGESQEELEALAAAWLATVPGDSHLLQTLRAQLLLSDCQLRRDQKSLHVVENGVTITSTEQPASFWIEKNLWNHCIGFTRQFEFSDTVIPPEYAYVLTHNGGPQPPSKYLNITYSPEEFEKLCRLEVASGSLHLLDGPRQCFQLLH